MRAAPALRIGIALVDTHPVVVRARRAMERMRFSYGSVLAHPHWVISATLSRTRTTSSVAAVMLGTMMTGTWTSAHDRS